MELRSYATATYIQQWWRERTKLLKFAELIQMRSLLASATDVEGVDDLLAEIDANLTLLLWQVT